MAVLLVFAIAVLLAVAAVVISLSYSDISGGA